MTKIGSNGTLLHSQNKHIHIIMQASPSSLVTASHHSPAPKQASGQEIRSRLLRRLGIHEDEDTMVTSSTESSSLHSPATLQQRPAPTFFHVPLKYNNNNNTPSHSSVGFQEHVRVVPIPMRTEYSERIRNRLWCNKHELHAMASRNLLEYEYEGWNPQTVLGDEYMIYSQTTGELVHPVHCRSLLQGGRAEHLFTPPISATQSQQNLSSV